jgi:hypothetical protein
LPTESQKDVLADFYAIVSDFYDRIMTQYGKKKIKGREHVRTFCIVQFFLSPSQSDGV